MPVKKQIISMIDCIPESDLSLLLEIIRRFVPADIDDFATAEDLEAHRIAMEEYENGEALDDSDIDWD